MSALEDIIKQYCLSIKDHPDGLGEILRAWAFVGDGYGCYSTFELRPEFEEVKPFCHEFKKLFGRPYSADTRETGWGDPDPWYLERMSWFKHPNGIEVGWLWDGDGTLCFYIPELEDDFIDGTLTNSDCKKDHGWEFGYREQDND
jgi:hypothetical protein